MTTPTPDQPLIERAIVEVTYSDGSAQRIVFQRSDMAPPLRGDVTIKQRWHAVDVEDFASGNLPDRSTAEVGCRASFKGGLATYSVVDADGKTWSPGDTP